MNKPKGEMRDEYDFSRGVRGKYVHDEGVQFMNIPLYLQQDIDDGMDPDVVLSVRCKWCDEVAEKSIVYMMSEDVDFDEDNWVCEECLEEGDGDDEQG